MRTPHYKNYICLVDNYRRSSRKRNTYGRYRVGAKNPKQARKILQNAIGFGSVLVYYEDAKLLVGYKEIKKEVFDKNGNSNDNLGFVLKPVFHATYPINKR